MMVPRTPAGDETAIYSPEDMQKLVSFLWKERSQITAQSALLYVLLGAFAGLRPAEASTLDWKAINFTTNEIHLAAALPKIARTVPLQPNVLEFLHPYTARKGRIVIHERVTNLLRGYCAKAGVKHIPNGLRRSYSVYRLVETSPEVVEAETGAPAASTEGKRLKLLTPAVARRYWSILP